MGTESRTGLLQTSGAVAGAAEKAENLTAGVRQRQQCHQRQAAQQWNAGFPAGTGGAAQDLVRHRGAQGQTLPALPRGLVFARQSGAGAAIMEVGRRSGEPSPGLYVPHQNRIVESNESGVPQTLFENQFHKAGRQRAGGNGVALKRDIGSRGDARETGRERW